jgi:hypothetical protein
VNSSSAVRAATSKSRTCARRPSAVRRSTWRTFAASVWFSISRRFSIRQIAIASASSPRLARASSSSMRLPT